MAQKAISEYWKMAHKGASEKAFQKLGFTWRILGVIVSAVGGCIASFLFGGNTIVSIVSGIIGVVVWLLILLIVYCVHLRERLKTIQKWVSRANLWNDQIPTSLPD